MSRFHRPSGPRANAPSQRRRANVPSQRRRASVPSLRRRANATAWALIAVLLLMASPAWGYIVFLKDGSQITTKDKYRVEGDRVLLTMPNGTEASYPVSEVDIEKTEKVNVIDYGTATLLEGLDKPRQPKVVYEEDPSFGEYITGRNLALPTVRKRQAATPTDELPTTQAGFVDLMAFRRSPYPASEITGEVLGYLKGQGIDRVRIFQGTEADRPLIEVVAASEASVFKAIKDSASGLVQIHESFPELVKAFELLLMTESQQRAGQFVMTPELANQLVSGQLTAPQFFLRFVEF